MFTVFEMAFCTSAEIHIEFAPLLAVLLLA